MAVCGFTQFVFHDPLERGGRQQTRELLFHLAAGTTAPRAQLLRQAAERRHRLLQALLQAAQLRVAQGGAVQHHEGAGLTSQLLRPP